MKITTQQLRKIIKEETGKLLQENEAMVPVDDATLRQVLSTLERLDKELQDPKNDTGMPDVDELLWQAHMGMLRARQALRKHLGDDMNPSASRSYGSKGKRRAAYDNRKKVAR